MIFIAILAHHTTLAYYAYQSKLHFLRNAMIFCSLVKIITTHAHEFIKKQIKKFFLGQSVVTLATHCVSSIQTTSNLLCGKCIFIHTHTKRHLYVYTQKYANITYTNTYTHIKSCIQF